MSIPATPLPDKRLHELLERILGEEVNITALELTRNIGLAHHILAAFAERDMEGEVTFAQFRMLSWLYMQDSDSKAGLLPSQLSKMQGVTPNTVSSLIQHLLKQGLIERVNHPEDRRKRIIKITETGRTFVRESAPRQYEHLVQLLGGLNAEEQQILMTLTRKLVTTIKQRAQVCEARKTLEPNAPSGSE
jgi:DNA-binding MarR family transcriptional regulator